MRKIVNQFLAILGIPGIFIVLTVKILVLLTVQIAKYQKFLLILILFYLGTLSIGLDVNYEDGSQWVLSNSPRGQYWGQVLITIGHRVSWYCYRYCHH